jgi:hypothetical protein
MTSPRKIQANRANAQTSTGPKSARGKARAAHNARRHGLSPAVFADPVLSAQVEALAREIAGKRTNDDNIYQLARRIAEAQIDLQRVRGARHQFLSDRLHDHYYESRASTREKLSVLRDLLRPRAPEIPIAVMAKYLKTTPQGPHKLATILLEEAKQLLAMDRYERRALSRRKFAIRAYDEARRRQLIA